MREKGRKRKDKKILIRVNRDEKKLAEVLSKAEGKNTSEFFRWLLAEHAKKISMCAVIEDAVAKGFIKVLYSSKKKRRKV